MAGSFCYSIWIERISLKQSALHAGNRRIQCACYLVQVWQSLQKV
jgi:hypothetical protein